MKSFTIAFVLLSFGGFAISQTGSLNRPVATADIDAQRSAIAEERNRAETGFLSEDAACYKKFAVNRCLENVNARRRSMMANLRQQEIQLNDEQRRSKGAEQLRKTQEKSSSKSLQQDRNSRNKAVEDFRERQVREQENVQRRDAAVASEAAARKASAARLQTHEKKMEVRTEKQSNAPKEAEKFNQRQVQAQERRTQHEAEQANRAKSAAKPLPMPQ